MSKITRRTLARGGALCLVGAMAAPAAPGLAQSDKRESATSNRHRYPSQAVRTGPKLSRCLQRPPIICAGRKTTPSGTAPADKLPEPRRAKKRRSTSRRKPYGRAATARRRAAGRSQTYLSSRCDRHLTRPRRRNSCANQVQSGFRRHAASLSARKAMIA
jgi:hypothetical protein